MIINKYIVKKDDIYKFKGILKSYCVEHKKKINEFTLRIIWKKNDIIINKISIQQIITVHMFRTDMCEIPIYVEVSKREFQDFVDRNCVYNITSDEIDIIIISKFEEITLQKYMKKPRSMLCRRLELNYVKGGYPVESELGYIFLPHCFRHKIF